METPEAELRRRFSAFCSEHGVVIDVMHPEISGGLIGFGVDAQRRRVVVKAGRFSSDFFHEMQSLAAFPAGLFPKLLAWNEELECGLMERLDVRGDLSSLFPSAASEYHAWRSVVDQIRESPHPEGDWPTLEDFSRVLTDALPLADEEYRACLDLTSDVLETLLAKDQQRVWTHGDLHHFNVLRTGDGRWRPIDPHGVLAPPGYEWGALFRNPWDRIDPYLSRPGWYLDRLEQFARLANEDPQDVLAWATVGVGMSIAWSLIDREPIVPAVSVMSQILGPIIRSSAQNRP